MINKIKERFLEVIRDCNMLEPGDRVLVAVSGGADSVAMLHLFCECQEALGITLHVAHLNHMIRKKEAETDVRFVQTLVQKLKVPITVESFDVQSYAKEEKRGLEESARQIRYAFYERAANQVGANKVAVGHTADDNVETFLMRLLRGSGLKGLCGIPPKRGNIIRPLIKTWRREIEDYVGALKIVPRRDYTNYESKYMRNRVRLKLIPQLKIYNMNIKEIILQTILLLTQDSSYLEAKAEEAMAETFIASEKDELRLEIEGIIDWEEPIQGHLLRKAIERIKGNLFDLTYRHIQDIIEKLDAEEKWELHLPGGIFVSGYQGELVISHNKPVFLERKTFCYSLPIPGEIEIKETGKKLRATIVKELPEKHAPHTAFIEHPASGEGLIVRSRQEGDRFVPLGMKGSKKIQDLFVDEKIAEDQRDTIPIVEAGEKILWVAGLRVDDRAKVTPETKRVVKLELL